MHSNFSKLLSLLLLLFFPVNCQETVPNTVNFVGHYRQISATNYDAFLQEIGIPGYTSFLTLILKLFNKNVSLFLSVSNAPSPPS